MTKGSQPRAFQRVIDGVHTFPYLTVHRYWRETLQPKI